MRQLLLSLFCACICFGCSSKKDTVRVGIDPAWYPLELDGKNGNVVAFVEELFKELSNETKYHYEVIPYGWDNLVMHLNQGDCQAILSSMRPHLFNHDKYAFSPIVLETGPVLIVQKSSKIRSIEQMKNASIAVAPSSDGLQYVSKMDGIIPIPYNSIPHALDMVISGSFQGALLEVIVALSYVKDLYSDDLKIVGKPLLDQGLRFAVLKADEKRVEDFTAGLKTLQSSGTYKKLLKKWNVGE